MKTKGDRLRDACQQAVLAFRKINQPEFEDIIAKLDFCIGSYNFDKNPVGLVEYGHIALELLNEVRKNNPKKVSQTLVKKLEDSLF